VRENAGSAGASRSPKGGPGRVDVVDQEHARGDAATNAKRISHGPLAIVGVELGEVRSIDDALEETVCDRPTERARDRRCEQGREVESTRSNARGVGGNRRHEIDELRGGKPLEDQPTQRANSIDASAELERANRVPQRASVREGRTHGVG